MSHNMSCNTHQVAGALQHVDALHEGLVLSHQRGHGLQQQQQQQQ
jgi:hypothetical protein